MTTHEKGSALRYSTTTTPPPTPKPERQWEPGPGLCPTKTPERHLAGEFPLTCYACHMVADA